MNSAEIFIFTAIPLIFMTLGMLCILKSEFAYKYNMKMVEDYAKSVENIPLFGLLAKANVKFYKHSGISFIRVWGFLALIIGIVNLIAMINQITSH